MSGLLPRQRAVPASLAETRHLQAVQAPVVVLRARAVGWQVFRRRADSVVRRQANHHRGRSGLPCSRGLPCNPFAYGLGPRVPGSRAAARRCRRRLDDCRRGNPAASGTSQRKLGPVSAGVVPIHSPSVANGSPVPSLSSGQVVPSARPAAIRLEPKQPGRRPDSSRSSRIFWRSRRSCSR